MDKLPNWETTTEENDSTAELFALARLLVAKAGSLPCIEYYGWECPRHQHKEVCPKDSLGSPAEFAKWKKQHKGDVRLVIDCWRAYIHSTRVRVPPPEELDPKGKKKKNKEYDPDAI